MRFFHDSLSAELWSRNCQVVGDPTNFIKQLVKLRTQSGVSYDDQRAMMEGFFLEVRAGSVPIDKRDLWKVFLARRQKYMRGRVVTEQTTRKVIERIHH